jgi:hypothetical protein
MAVWNGASAASYAQLAASRSVMCASAATAAAATAAAAVAASHAVAGNARTAAYASNTQKQQPVAHHTRGLPKLTLTMAVWNGASAAS